LIFAPRSPEDHLARFGLADLFLDTLPYNAHTTASDALWTGVPVVTCQGKTFAGRVASSLLRAAGLSNLITESMADYEALCIKLGRDRDALTALKQELSRNRLACPLFDTTQMTRL
jgi:predicted O-linked N-acetylglucosamine transferase (SPINDLY family)